MTEHIVLFSGGIASWGAAKRVAERHGMKGLGPVSPKQIIEHIDICYQRINVAVREAE